MKPYVICHMNSSVDGRILGSRWRPAENRKAGLFERLHRVFDAFGADRTFWGTDITRMPCSWRQCVTVFTEELPWLKGRDLELVMGEALCNWVGWPLPG